jgi:hypothetical protein
MESGPAALGGELAHAISQRFEVRHHPSMTRAVTTGRSLTRASADG